MKTLMILILSTIIGSGCSIKPDVRYIIKPLPLAVRPVLPAIKDSELICLPENVRKKMKTRDRERRQYAEELEVIIKSTHNLFKTESRAE